MKILNFFALLLIPSLLQASHENDLQLWSKFKIEKYGLFWKTPYVIAFSLLPFCMLHEEVWIFWIPYLSLFLICLLIKFLGHSPIIYLRSDGFGEYKAILGKIFFNFNKFIEINYKLSALLRCNLKLLISSLLLRIYNQLEVFHF